MNEGGWSRGVRLGIDVGRARVGVARCDPDGILATPLVTLARDLSTQGSGIPADISQIVQIAAELAAVEVVVGLPVSLSGREGLAATEVRRYGEILGSALAPIPVRWSDERMSTVVASRRLSERGVRGRRQRAVVDQAAAVEILQCWLDTQRRRT